MSGRELISFSHIGSTKPEKEDWDELMNAIFHYQQKQFSHHILSETAVLSQFIGFPYSGTFSTYFQKRSHFKLTFSRQLYVNLAKTGHLASFNETAQEWDSLSRLEPLLQKQNIPYVLQNTNCHAFQIPTGLLAIVFLKLFLVNRSQ